MAKRKAVGLGPRWQEADEIELLAWLDYTLKHDLSFKDTVLDHLKSRRKKSFKSTQIDYRLKYLWNSLASDDARSWKEVFTKGSSCLEFLDGNARKAVTHTSMLLGDQLISKRPAEPRSQRSTITPNSQLVEHRTSPKNSKPSTPRQQRQQDCELPKLRKRKRPPVELEPEKIISSKRRKEKPPKPEVVVLSQQDTPNLENSNTESDNQHRLTAAGNSEDSLSSNADEKSEYQIVRLEKENVKLQSFEPEAKTSTQQPLGNASTKIKRLRHKHSARMESKELEVRRLQTELSQTQIQNQALQDQIESLRAARDQRKCTAGKSMEDIILEKDNHIGGLIKEINNIRKLGSFTKPSRVYGGRPKATYIEEEMMQIKHEVKNILYAHDDEELLNVPNIDRRNSLRLLICKSLSLDPHESINIEGLTLCLSELRSQAVVRSLTWSAIREWVFETDFPNCFQGASPLLTKYREHLLALDGATALNNLDLAAHSSLINDPFFRHHTIHSSADRLATKLAKTLAPFFPNNAPCTGTKTFANWGQSECLSEERRTRFIEIFELALRLKADSVLNGQSYEMVLYAPGARFDSKTMEVETMEGAPVDPPKFEGRTVELCVNPSVYAYTEPDSKGSSSAPAGPVQLRNFMHRHSDQRKEATVVTKAAVVLKAGMVVDSDGNNTL